MQDLNSLVDNSDLVEVKSTGHFYSWSSKGDGMSRIHSRIDRCFANFCWLQQHFLLAVEYLNPAQP